MPLHPDNATYIATKADIARLEEQVKGLDRAVEVRFQGIERLQAERSGALREILGASQRAVDKSEQAQHNVNVASNEFRKSLEDLTKHQATRTELESLDKRVQALTLLVSDRSGKSDGQVRYTEGRSAAFLSAKGDILAIIAILLAAASFIAKFLVH